MITIWTVITALVLFLGGHCILALFRPTRPKGAIELHGTALLLGLAVVPALVTGLVLALGPLGSSVSWALSAVLALGGVFGMRGHPGAAAPVQPKQALGGWERAGLVLIFFFGAFVVFYTSTMPMHIFDPLFHFAYKGKLLFHEGLMTSSWMDVEDSVGRIITHPDYPPGIGATLALHGWLGPGFSEDTARPLFGLFALGMAALLYGSLADLGRRGSRLAPITGTLLWLASPFLYYSRLPHKEWAKGAYGLFFGPDAGRSQFGDESLGQAAAAREWSMPDGWTLDGAGDLPLAALFCAGAMILLRYTSAAKQRRDSADLLIAGALLGGGALVKNEGLALLAVIAAAVAMTWLVDLARSRRSTRASPESAGLPVPLALALSLLVACVVASPWLAVRGSIPTIGEDYPSRLSPAGLAESWNGTQEVRSLDTPGQTEQQGIPGIVSGGFATAVTNVPRFGVLWLLFFGALLLGLLRPKRLTSSPALGAALTVLGAFGLYALVLFVTPWNLEALFRTAIPDRLIFHVAPLAIFASILILDHVDQDEA